MGVRDKFTTLLKELIKAYESREHEDGIYISSLSTCLRKAFYEQFFPVYETKLSKPVFEGTAIHYFIDYLVKNYGNLLMENIDSEVRVRYIIDDIKLVGRADIVLDDRIIEVKTTSNIPFKPYTSHVLQANAYAYILRKKYFEIAYISNDRIKSFVYETRKDLFDVIVERARILSTAFKTGIAPDREVSQLCVKCPFYDKCFNQLKLNV